MNAFGLILQISEIPETGRGGPLCSVAGCTIILARRLGLLGGHLNILWASEVWAVLGVVNRAESQQLELALARL